MSFLLMVPATIFLFVYLEAVEPAFWNLVEVISNSSTESPLLLYVYLRA